MFNLSLPYHQIIVRALLIYIGLFLIFRFIGKKQLGEMSPFDFVLLLIVSESISNGLSGGENSVTGGLLSALTLIGFSTILDYFVFRSKKFEKIVEGEPQVLIQNGVLDEKLLDSLKITKSELMECLRDRELEDIREVKKAVLETNGRITVLKKPMRSEA